MLHEMYADQKEIVLCVGGWGRGLAIRGNEAADRAAKEVLDKEPTDGLTPISDLGPLTVTYIHQVWQKEWDE